MSTLTTCENAGLWLNIRRFYTTQISSVSIGFQVVFTNQFVDNKCKDVASRLFAHFQYFRSVFRSPHILSNNVPLQLLSHYVSSLRAPLLFKNEFISGWPFFRHDYFP